MQNTLNRRAGFYLLCGLVAYGIDQIMSLEFMVGQEGRITSLVIAVPVAGLLCSITLASMNRCFRKPDFSNLCFCWVCSAPLALSALAQAFIGLVSPMTQRSAGSSRSINPFSLPSALWKRQKATGGKGNRAVLAETSSGGCGRVCRDKKQLAKEARQRYESAKLNIVKLGSTVSPDPTATRLAEILSVPEKQDQTLYPLLLPIGIWLASIAFIGMALNEFDSSRPASKEKQAPKEELPLQLRIATFMDQQEQLDGKRPHPKWAKSVRNRSEKVGKCREMTDNFAENVGFGRKICQKHCMVNGISPEIIQTL